MIQASEREQLLRIYAETRTIAVVGASADESKAGHQIPLYLQSDTPQPQEVARLLMALLRSRLFEWM